MAHQAAEVFYAVLGVVCALTLISTLWYQPLFDWKLDDVDWLKNWLKMTVLDYYGAALPLCGIAISTEQNMQGFLWSAGFLFGGSPFCCAYMLYRLRLAREDGLRLVD